MASTGTFILTPGDKLRSRLTGRSYTILSRPYLNNEGHWRVWLRDIATSRTFTAALNFCRYQCEKGTQ